MKRKYNAGSKSDMRRFSTDMEQKLREITARALQNKEYSLECPSCDSVISIKPGKQNCPVCNGELNFKLNIDEKAF